MSFRWFRPDSDGGCYVIAEYFDACWHIHVTDAASRSINDDRRKLAIEEVMRELSSLRSHLWHEELKNPRVESSA